MGTAAKPVAKSKYESDIKTHRMEKLGSFTADIKKVEDDAEMDADKREYKLYTFKQHQDKFVSVGTTVTLPPFSEYILETEAAPQKERGRDACREFTKACRVFNLDAAFEKHDPEITGTVIKNGCSVTVHKKAETEEGEMEFLFRLDHELEDTLPSWKQMLKDAKAGKPKPQRPRSATLPNVRQGLCEMAIAKLIEDGIMEDENAVERVLQERKEAAEAIRAEKAAEKEQRKAENEAAREKKQEEKEARKAEMAAKKGEKDRLKAERVAAHEARTAEAKRNKEQKQRNAQKNRQASPNKGQNNRGRNNQSAGANNNKNKPGQKRNWNQQSRNGGNNYSAGQPQQQQQVWTQPMQQMGYQQPPAQPTWAAQQPATGASWGQPKRAKGDDGKMAQMIALQQQQMEQMRQMHEQQLAAMGNSGGTGSNW